MWPMIAMAALSVYQGHQQSKAQDALSEANWENAVISQMYENRGINEQLREEYESAADQKRDMQVKALKAASTLQARGRQVSGADGQTNEIFNELGRQIGIINKNLEGKQRQTAMEKRGSTARAESRINSVPRGSYDPTADIVGAGLAIGAGYMNAKADYSKATGGKGKLEFGDYFWGRTP